MENQGVLRDMLNREITKRYGAGHEVAIDEERGVWVKGLKDQTVAATTLRGLAERLGVSLQPMTNAAARKMLGVVGEKRNLARFVVLKNVPHTGGGTPGKPLILYRHEVQRWIEESGHNTEKYHARAMAQSVGRKRASLRRANAGLREAAVAEAPAVRRAKSSRAVNGTGVLTRLTSFAAQAAAPPLLTSDAIESYIVEAGIEAFNEWIGRRGTTKV